MTPEQFDGYKMAFEKGNRTVDYAYRNCITGDEEEIRLVESYKTDGDEYINEFPMPIRGEIKKWIKLMCLAQTGSYAKVMDLDDYLAEGEDWGQVVQKIADILEPHISNRELKNQSYSMWENVFFAGDYEDFEEMEIYLGRE